MAVSLGAFAVVISERVAKVRFTGIGMALQDQDSLAHLAGSRCKQRSRGPWFGDYSSSFALTNIEPSNAYCASQYGFYHASAAHVPISGQSRHVQNIPSSAGAAELSAFSVRR